MSVHGPTELGTGALLELPGHLDARRCRRVLLVTGRASFEASGAARAVPALERVAEVTRWSDFSPNTDVDDLANGLEVLERTDADAIIGIGGGSVMDMAKLLCAFRGAGSREALHAAIRSGATIDDRDAALMLAPTTSGSGSEATHFAVVYIGSDKFSIAGAALRADVVALDPTLAMSGSPHQRATSGMDAVCQAIESRWAAGASRRSRRYAEFALRLLVNSIEPFVASPDYGSAQAMQLGSHLAGRAIDISKTTAAHALSYGITKRYGVDHGNAAALTLGHFIEEHASSDVLQPGIDAADHRAAMRSILDTLGAADGAEGRARFTSLLDRLDLPSTLTQVGYRSPDELTLLSESVNAERLGNNPVVFTTEGLRSILGRAVA